MKALFCTLIFDVITSAKKLRVMNLWMGFYSFGDVDVVSNYQP